MKKSKVLEKVYLGFGQLLSQADPTALQTLMAAYRAYTAEQESREAKVHYLIKKLFLLSFLAQF